jgi:hypothetical protein
MTNYHLNYFIKLDRENYGLCALYAELARRRYGLI